MNKLNCSIVFMLNVFHGSSMFSKCIINYIYWQNKRENTGWKYEVSYFQIWGLNRVSNRVIISEKKDQLCLMAITCWCCNYIIFKESPHPLLAQPLQMWSQQKAQQMSLWQYSSSHIDCINGAWHGCHRLMTRQRTEINCWIFQFESPLWDYIHR